MKKLVFFSLFVNLIIAQETTSYSWEDGAGTILGSYGNLAAPANVGTTSGISPYDGSRMLTVSESPLDGTPQAFIAWVTDLSAGQDIEACFYGYDNTPSSAPSLRVWGSWSTNDDITSYGGSADGNTDYTDGSGWGQVCHTFSTNQENWDAGEALVIQARLYSSSSGSDPTVYFIDLVEVTAPGSATVNYPGTSAGCTNVSACNYNPFADDDDGSCVYPEGSISIHDIQYTSVQGDYCYESIHDQECWTTSGTVTAKHPLYSNFYIQDENSSSYAGIYIHGYSAALPTLGQDITITATVNEYYSLTQLIDGASYSVNSSGNSVEPTDISTGDLLGCLADGEAVESMLVRINNVTVTTPSNEFGEWYVDDGSGPVMINDKIFDGEEWLDPSSSQEFGSIIGVVDYAYSEFSILPRTMSDIVLCPTCPVAAAGDDQMVAPEGVVTLDGSGSYDPDGSIIAYEWIQTGGTAVDLIDEEAATTAFTAPSTNGDLVFKLTVYDNDYNSANDEITISVGYGTPIQDIQCPSDLSQGTYCYETSMAGEEVSTYGVVTHVLAAGHSSEGNFFLQQPGVDECAGIFIRDFDIVPIVGDELTLTGTVNEYYSFTQIIDVTSSSSSNTGNSITPLAITTATLGVDCSLQGEELEGMLVRVSDVTVEDIDEFGNIQINDGSGPTLMDDYYFDGTLQGPSVGDTYPSIIGIVGYSYSEFKIYPRNEDDFDNCSLGDLNGDGGYNVLDIVTLANCVLDGTCGGRVDDASNASLIQDENNLFIKGNGFIGGVQMTLTHGPDFSIETTDRALFADYLTTGNTTRLLVITPKTDKLFSFKGEFEITELIVANSQNEIPTLFPNIYSLSSAYPNPFNPITTMTLTIPEAGNVNVHIYNLHGQIVNTLLSGNNPANTYSLVWDASNSPSGMYFVKAEFGGITETQKLMLIK